MQAHGSSPVLKSHEVLTAEVTKTNITMTCIYYFLQTLFMLALVSYLSVVYISPVIIHSKQNTDEIYPNEVIFTQYLPLLMLPFISYLIIVYVQPLISEKANNYFCMKQDENFDDDQQAKVEITKRWKVTHLGCAYGANTLIYLIFYIRPVKLIHLVNIGKDVHSADQYIIYINTLLPVLVLTLLTVTMIAGFVVKCRKIKFISTVSMSISVNIIYVLCYSFPRMVIAFVHDPVLTIHTCFTAISIAVSFYPLLFCCSGMTLLSRMARMHTLFPCNCFPILTAFTHSCFFCMFLVFIFGAVILTESYSDHQYLQISYLLISFLAICVFKPIHHHAYKHVIENAKLMLNVLGHNNPWMDDDEDKSSSTTDSCTGANQHLVYLSEVKEVDDDLQSDNGTIV